MGVGHAGQKLVGEGFVVGAESGLFLAHSVSHVGVVGEQLHGPGDGGGGGILGGKEEIEDGEGEFLVCVLVEKR
jgi:hypothetical protein